MKTPPQCPHAHTRLIAEDEHEKYLECLDCGAILGPEEARKSGNAAETLSDA
jgi:translation initiation factor 2 beta subunit (eIF-2beta)/eIF-5